MVVPPPNPLPASAPPAVRLDGSAPVAGPAAVRMDVAAFVGRAKFRAGEKPTLGALAVESADEFADAFDEVADSRLGPAVRAFFRNGGRRCWVIPAEPPFRDPRFNATGIPSLVREAAIEGEDGTPLLGVHAILALEEVTLLAVPDAFPPRSRPARSGTDAPATPGPGSPAASTTLFKPFKLPDAALLALDLTFTPKKQLPAPDAKPPLRDWGELAWDWHQKSAEGTPEAAEEDAARAGARFVLERSTSAKFPPAETETLYRGPGRSLSVGRESASYRVRAETATLVGGWSVPQSQSLPVGQPVADTEDPAWTQIAAIKVCAARGDVLAVLTPPEEWPTGTATDWVKQLQANRTAWGAEDSRALQTHAAFWGPWLLTSDGGEPSEAEPDRFPADGAVCGLLARRSLERGAWASILNLPLAGALGLGPAPYGPGELVPLFAAELPGADRAASDSREAVTRFQRGGINALARTPRGFVPVGERTACPDPTDLDADRRPEAVAVRRFMALLRRQLARVGVDFAFQPNGPALERRAVRAVEAVLEDLLRRGALVGPDARASFQVSVSSGTGDNVLELEVRVRPAYPLRVLTLRLIRSPDAAFGVAEVPV